MNQKLYKTLFAFAAIAAVIVLALAGFELSFAFGRVPAHKVQKTDKVRYIAHRGLSSVYYENTAEAFIGAGESDFFYGIETDVWMTEDGIWMCAHDDTPFADRTKHISDIRYAEAASLPLKEVQGVTPAGQDARLCDFAAFLEICRDKGKTPIIEIKFAANKDEIKSLLAATEKILPLCSVQFISFHKSAVDELLKNNNRLIAQLLVTNAWDAYRFARRGYHIGAAKGSVSEMLIKTVNGNQSYINVWTVNDPPEAARLAAMGVDFITTDCILFE